MIIFDPLQPIIQANGLSKEVNMGKGKLGILSNVGLSINAGETVAILGPSGAGKTTLLGLLAGLDLPSTGQVLFGDIDFAKISEEERTKIRGQYFGFIFQMFYLLENLTVLENVMLPLELQGHEHVRECACKLIEEVGLSDRINHFPRLLSGGEQQRVAIARAFACMPRVLFADEPTGSLDQETGDKIIQLLFNLNKDKQTTLVFVTHDLCLANKCDRHVQLSKGSIEEIMACKD